MRVAPLTAALLLAGTACSAAPQQTGQTGAELPTPAPNPAQKLPRNAPDYGVTNVPATRGKANLPDGAPPFASTQIGQFDQSFAMAFLPDGRLLVTEKTGHLKLRATDGSVRDIAGVPAVAFKGQGGLLDVAIAPDFASSRTIYLSYSEPRSGEQPRFGAGETRSGRQARWAGGDLACRVGRNWRAVRRQHPVRARRQVIVPVVGRAAALRPGAGPRPGAG